jgi:hypothetical protein
MWLFCIPYRPRWFLGKPQSISVTLSRFSLPCFSLFSSSLLHDFFPSLSFLNYSLSLRWIGFSLWMKFSEPFCFVWPSQLHTSERFFWVWKPGNKGEERWLGLDKCDPMVLTNIRHNWSCGTWEINCGEGNIWCAGMSFIALFHCVILMQVLLLLKENPYIQVSVNLWGCSLSHI